MNMNQVVLMGHAGADAKLFANEKPDSNLLSFNLATNHYYIDKTGEKITQTDWHQVRLYGKIATRLQSRINKGQAVFVEGELKNSISSEKNGIRYQSSFIKAKRVILMAPPSASYDTPSPTTAVEFANS